MREILFKGKRVDNGEWVYGHYWFSEKQGKHFICGESIDYGYQSVVVDPETVCQYTGLTDKNGMIFEGDIVKHESDGVEYIGEVKFGINISFVGGGRHIGFFIKWKPVNTFATCMRNDLDFWKTGIEVIGNIHDESEGMK